MPTSNLYSQTGYTPGARTDPTGKTPGVAQTGYYNPNLAASPMQVSGNQAPPSQMASIDRNGAAAAFAPRDPMQNPGNNLTNPGYDEQAFLYTQNRYLNDPSAGLLKDQYNNLQNPTQGEQFMTTAAALEYMFHKKTHRPALHENDEEDDDNEDHDGGADYDSEHDKEEAKAAKLREEAGQDWMVEQGFDRKE